MTPLALYLILFAADLPETLKQPAFQHFYNLEFDEALKDFQSRAAAEPSSPDVQNLIAQAVIFRTMFKAGALESSLVSDKNPFFDRPKAAMSAEEEKLFLDSLDRATSLAKARLDKNADDAQALYALGVAYGLKADYDFVVKKAWIGTLRDFTQARKLHTRVSELAPRNYDARLTPGMHAYISGNLVFPWKQLGFLAGFHGDKETGIRILREVAEHGEYNKADAAMFLEAIYRRDHRSAEGLPFIEDLIRWFPRNYIFRLEQVRLYIDLKQSAKASALLSEIEHTRGFENIPPSRLQELHTALSLPQPPH